MTLPSVSIQKQTFSSVQAPASSTGVLAILAASNTGTSNVPGGYARSDLAGDDYGGGPLVEFFAYDVNVANHPAVLVKGNATFPGTYGAIINKVGAFTCVAGATAPYDRFDVVVTFLTGGTVGVSGITYTYSLDGGESTSGIQQLGAATSLAIPNSNVAFTLGGTVVAQDTFECFTERPLMNNADVTAGLTALGNSRLPHEGVLVDCSATVDTVGLIDTILSGWEARGVFKFFIINSRFKADPEPSAESETAYAASIAPTFANQTSIRGCVGADGAHVASPITGIVQKRPTSLLLAARAMATEIGEDPAYVGRGAITGARIADTNGNPLDHDEELYPNLDSLRLTSLRSFAPGGPQGVYICNANSIQPSGGAFPYLQHIRIMNRACEIAWYVLTTQLSLGVRKNLKPDPVTGVVTIYEPDAAKIDALVNDALFQPLKGQVSAAQFSLSRTDDMNAVPCVVTGTLQIVALAYIKGVQVKAEFVKTLSTTV